MEGRRCDDNNDWNRFINASEKEEEMKLKYGNK
jgi:hypothetical protein